MLTNDNATLTPKTEAHGPHLQFELPGMLVGTAEYEAGPTGCTVFIFPAGAATAIDVRGGSVGAIGNYEWNHAICLAGGSLYGLEAATGAAAELFAQRAYSTKLPDMALVSGAIIYDYGPRQNTIYPDKQLGRAAVASARPGRFPLGRRGAGASATVGKVFAHQGEYAGQGGTFRTHGETKIAVFSVVNALGVIVNREGRVVLGNRDDAGKRWHPLEALEKRPGADAAEAGHPPGGNTTPNTTLTVVATNQKLSRHGLVQLARQVHSSMARAIQPFHTGLDGDVLYAVSTNAVENKALGETELGLLASEAAWDAILASVQP